MVYVTLMFLSEWREFPSAHGFAGGVCVCVCVCVCVEGWWELDDSSRLDVVEIARVA